MWEYKVVELAEAFGKVDREEKLLNSYGKDRWELVSVTESDAVSGRIHCAYLKREIK